MHVTIDVESALCIRTSIYLGTQTTYGDRLDPICMEKLVMTTVIWAGLFGTVYRNVAIPCFSLFVVRSGTRARGLFETCLSPLRTTTQCGLIAMPCMHTGSNPVI